MIKAIAVDKDGTLFKSNHTFDEVYFEKIFEEAMKRNIKFIVASGNQYAQLRSYFPGKETKITYVAENGAVTYANDTLLSSSYFDESLIFEVLQTILVDYKISDVILSGVKTAYVREDCSDEFMNFIRNYYFNVKKVAQFSEIKGEQFVKVAMRIRDNHIVEQVIAGLESKYGSEIRAVTSGAESVDLILPGVNKGVAIQALLNNWEIDHNELLAFGDANNDLEMLALTKYSYAMAKCSPEVEKVAQYRAPSNDQSGVLQVIESYFNLDN
ncbi:MAG TPA: Cof-type HAD-IIB family hydrolase [Staphylococcus sp.]|nr:Cof-type HAD-IIB family hydrolase [Staphylococcus sp.]